MLEKIIKTDREHLINQAGSKYDATMTVVKAKALRMKPVEEQQSKEIDEEKYSLPQEESVPVSVTDFTLPDDIVKIEELVTIIQTHPGNEKITINNKEMLVNEQGKEKIHHLLTST